MLNSIKCTLKAGDALIFTDNEAKKFAELCNTDASTLKQIVASAFLYVRDETLEACKRLATLNILNSSQGRIFQYEGINDVFILYLENRIKKDHFLNNMIEICYASGSAERPSGDAPVRIVEKIQIIRQFIYQSAKLKTLLHYVIRTRNHQGSEKEKILNTELIFRCNVNALDNNHETVLICAAKLGYTNIAKVLLKHSDLDVNIPNIFGNTALICAATGGYTNIVSALLEWNDLDVNIKDNEGDTALTCAILLGKTSIIKALLKHKDIDVKVRDAEGRTALRIAIERNKIGIIQLLAEKISQDSGIDTFTN